MKDITHYFAAPHNKKAMKKKKTTKSTDDDNPMEVSSPSSDEVYYEMRKIKIRRGDPNIIDSYVCEVYPSIDEDYEENKGVEEPVIVSPVPGEKVDATPNTSTLARKRNRNKNSHGAEDSSNESSSDETLISVRKKIKSSIEDTSVSNDYDINTPHRKLNTKSSSSGDTMLESLEKAMASESCSQQSESTSSPGEVLQLMSSGKDNIDSSDSSIDIKRQTRSQTPRKKEGVVDLKLEKDNCITNYFKQMNSDRITPKKPSEMSDPVDNLNNEDATNTDSVKSTDESVEQRKKRKSKLTSKSSKEVRLETSKTNRKSLLNSSEKKSKNNKSGREGTNSITSYFKSSQVGRQSSNSIDSELHEIPIESVDSPDKKRNWDQSKRSKLNVEKKPKKRRKKGSVSLLNTDKDEIVSQEKPPPDNELHKSPISSTSGDQHSARYKKKGEKLPKKGQRRTSLVQAPEVDDLCESTSLSIPDIDRPVSPEKPPRNMNDSDMQKISKCSKSDSSTGEHSDEYKTKENSVEMPRTRRKTESIPNLRSSTPLLNPEDIRTVNLENQTLNTNGSVDKDPEASTNNSDPSKNIAESSDEVEKKTHKPSSTTQAPEGDDQGSTTSQVDHKNKEIVTSEKPSPDINDSVERDLHKIPLSSQFDSTKDQSKKKSKKSKKLPKGCNAIQFAEDNNLDGSSSKPNQENNSENPTPKMASPNMDESIKDDLCKITNIPKSDSTKDECIDRSQNNVEKSDKLQKKGKKSRSVVETPEYKDSDGSSSQPNKETNEIASPEKPSPNMDDSPDKDLQEKSDKLQKKGKKLRSVVETPEEKNSDDSSTQLNKENNEIASPEKPSPNIADSTDKDLQELPNDSKSDSTKDENSDQSKNKVKKSEKLRRGRKRSSVGSGKQSSVNTENDEKDDEEDFIEIPRKKRKVESQLKEKTQSGVVPSVEGNPPEGKIVPEVPKKSSPGKKSVQKKLDFVVKQKKISGQGEDCPPEGQLRTKNNKNSDPVPSDEEIPLSRLIDMKSVRSGNSSKTTTKVEYKSPRGKDENGKGSDVNTSKTEEMTTEQHNSKSASEDNVEGNVNSCKTEHPEPNTINITDSPLKLTKAKSTKALKSNKSVPQIEENTKKANENGPTNDISEANRERRRTKSVTTFQTPEKCSEPIKRLSIGLHRYFKPKNECDQTSTNTPTLQSRLEKTPDPKNSHSIPAMTKERRHSSSPIVVKPRPELSKLTIRSYNSEIDMSKIVYKDCAVVLEKDARIDECERKKRPSTLSRLSRSATKRKEKTENPSPGTPKRVLDVLLSPEDNRSSPCKDSLSKINLTSDSEVKKIIQNSPLSRVSRSATKRKETTENSSPRIPKRVLDVLTSPGDNRPSPCNDSPSKINLSSDSEVKKIIQDCVIVLEKVIDKPKTETKKKIAPIFLKKQKKPQVDPEVLQARREFLKSGVPSSLKKTVAMAISVLETELPGFGPGVIHVQQKCDSGIWRKRTVDLRLSAPSAYDPPDIKWKSFKTPAVDIAKQPSNPDKMTLERIKNSNKNFSNCDALHESIKRKFEKYCNKKKKSKQKPTVDCSPMWTVKYQPESLDILSNDRVVSRLKDWLIAWRNYDEALRAGEAGDRKRRENSDSDSDSDDFVSDEEDERVRAPRTVCLLNGPSSSGKTALLQALAAELGFNVLEINASSKRTGKKILAELQEATKSHKVSMEGSNNLFGTNVKNDSKDAISIIVVEDADVVFDDEDGFIFGLQTLINTAKRPVFLLTTDRTVKHLEKFRTKDALQLEMKRPQTAAACAFLELIVLVEGANIARSSILHMLGRNNNDLRRCLLELQFWTKAQKPQNRTWPTTMVESMEPDRVWWGSHRLIGRAPLWHPSCGENTKGDPPNMELPEVNTSNAASTETEPSKLDNLKVLSNLNRYFDSLSVSDIVVINQSIYSRGIAVKRIEERDSVSLEEDLTLNRWRAENFSCDVSEDVISLCTRVVCPDHLDHMTTHMPAKEVRWFKSHKAASKELLKVVPLSTSTRGSSLDYLPNLRQICRVEQDRVNVNTKRRNRFYHYVKSIGGTPTDANLNLNCKVMFG